MLFAVLRVAAVVGVVCLTWAVNHYNTPTRHFQEAPRQYTDKRRPQNSGTNGGNARIRNRNLNTDCPICMEEIEGFSMELPCEHRLHFRCYNEFQAKSGSTRCPLCRKPM